MLEQLENQVPDLLNRVDLIAGTSTGAIIALLLATGATPQHAREMYENMVPKVFGSPRSVYARFLAAKYDRDPLEQVLRDYFGETTLGSLRKKIVVPALRINGGGDQQGWRPAVFTNLPAVSGAVPDLELTAVDAALRSAAAPTFFPAMQGYVDGGLFANNPSVVALGKTLLHLPHLRRNDVRVLSLGTGAWPKRVVTTPDMGIAQWSPYLLDLLLDASNLSAELTMAYLMKSSRYCRLDPQYGGGQKLYQPVALDDANAVPRLIRLGAEANIDHAIHFLNRSVFQNSDIRHSPPPRPTYQDPIAAIFGHHHEDDDDDDLDDDELEDDSSHDEEVAFSSSTSEEEERRQQLRYPLPWSSLVVDDAWMDAARHSHFKKKKKI